MSKPIVAIVGRPNVGKSTLFNMVSRKKIAIVEDEPGITRDRIYVDCEWLGREFTLVDTGGIEPASEDKIMAQMAYQAEIAIRESDVIIFVVDLREGVTPADQEVADMLRRTNKPVILVANKGEEAKHLANRFEFFSLGLGEPIPVSAAHGLNLGDLLDEVIKHLPEETEDGYLDDTIKVAVIGRPNVGKSSLVNALLGEERVIVSDIPGTTRDAIDTRFERDGEHFVLIDTAGMRRKGKIDEPVERYSVLRALRAIDRADIVLMMIDATEGVTDQDKKIAGYAHEAGRGCIIVVNKWDLIRKDHKTTNRYTEHVRQELGFLFYAPIIFVSAKTKQRVVKIIDLVKHVAEEQVKRISTSTVNNVLEEAIMLAPTPTDKGKRLKVYYASQTQVKPPTFAIFVNEPELMHFSYLRYLENKLREAFVFEGTPLKFSIRKRDREER